MDPTFAAANRNSAKISGLYGITVSGLNPVQGCSFFFVFCFCFLGSLFATARVASIIAMILFHVILHPAVLIYDFHKFITSVHTLLFQPLYNSQPFTLATLTKLRPVEIQNKLYITAFQNRTMSKLGAFLHGDGGPQIGEVTTYHVNVIILK